MLARLLGWALAIAMILFQGSAGAQERRGWLGVELAEAEKGARIARVAPGSPADLLGLKLGYTIVGIGRQPTETPADVISALARVPIGRWERIYYVVNQRLHLGLIVLSDWEAAARGEPYSLPRRGTLGISISDDKRAAGVRVESVAERGAAEEGGIRAGDIIVAINGRSVTNVDQLVKVISGRANERTHVAVFRRGREMSGWVVPGAVSQVGALERSEQGAGVASSNARAAEEEGFWCIRSFWHAVGCVGGVILVGKKVMDALSNPEARPAETSPQRDARAEERAREAKQQADYDRAIDLQQRDRAQEGNR